MPRKRGEPRPVQQVEPRLWCTRCGGNVIWMQPPEICLMCRGTEISREEQPDEDPEYFGFEEGNRRFIEAAHESYRLEAERRAAAGEGDESS